MNAAATAIEANYGRLDILVNIAGSALELGGPASEVTLETLRTTYETNVFGLFSVTKSMIPLL